MLPISCFGLGNHGGFYKIMQNLSLIVKCSCPFIVYKINPRFCRIYKMKIHISRHWICFVPNSSCLIIEAIFFCQLNNRLYLNNRHKHYNCTTAFYNTTQLFEIQIHALFPLFEVHIVPASTAKIVIPHCLQVGFPFLHK